MAKHGCADSGDRHRGTCPCHQPATAKGGNVQLARIFNCFGLGEACPLTSEINPTGRGTEGPAPFMPNLDPMESPANPFLSLKYQNIAAVLS